MAETTSRLKSCVWKPYFARCCVNLNSPHVGVCHEWNGCRCIHGTALFVCRTNGCRSASPSMGGVTGSLFVFRTRWGQTGSTELTMHLLVCNQPEISPKQTRSHWTETHSVHIFHLAANLLADKQSFPLLMEFCETACGLARWSPKYFSCRR